jgi:hypothetical protein
LLVGYFANFWCYLSLLQRDRFCPIRHRECEKEYLVDPVFLWEIRRLIITITLVSNGTLVIGDTPDSRSALLNSKPINFGIIN